MKEEMKKRNKKRNEEGSRKATQCGERQWEPGEVGHSWR